MHLRVLCICGYILMVPHQLWVQSLFFFPLSFVTFAGKNFYLSATNRIYLSTKEVEYFSVFISHWVFFLMKKYLFMPFVHFSFGNVLLFVSSFQGVCLISCKLPRFF